MKGKAQQNIYNNAIRRWKDGENTISSVGEHETEKGGIYCKCCGSKQPYTKTPLYKTNRDGIPLSQFKCMTCESAWVSKDFKRTGNTIGDILFQQFADKEVVKGLDLQTFDKLTAIGIEPVSETNYMRERNIQRHPTRNDVALTWRHPQFDGDTMHEIVCKDCGHESATFYKLGDGDYKCPNCSWATKGRQTGTKYLYVVKQ